MEELSAAHKRAVDGLCLGEDETLFSCSSDTTIKQWSASGELLQTFTGHDTSVNAIEVVNDYLYSASSGST